MTTGKDRVVAALKKHWMKTEEEQWIYGKMGRLNSDASYTFLVPGRPTFVYVTLRISSSAQTVAVARNDARVEHAANLNIKMRLEKGVYVIYGETGRQDLGSSPSSSPYGLVSHSTSHKHGGTDEVATATPTANAIPKANGSGLLDSWVSGVAAQTVAAAAKTTPVDADSFPIVDSAAANVLKELTFTNLKAFLKTYFDTLYNGLLSALAAKNPPVDADSFVITDSAASNVGKRVTGTNVKAYLKTYFDTLYGLLAGNNTWTGQNEVINPTYPPLRVTRSSAETNTNRGTTSSMHRTTADMVDGFGSTHSFETNDSAVSGTNIIGQIGTIRDGADNSGKMQLMPYAAGVVVIALEATKEGRIQINNILRALSASGIRIEDSSGNLGIFVENGGFVGIGGVTDPTAPLQVGGDNSGVQMIVYPSSGTNTRAMVRAIPRGAPSAANGRAIMQFFNTDFIADSTNYEYAQFGMINDTFEILSRGVGTGTTRPINIWTYNNANQLYLAASGFVGIREDNPAADLHIHMDTNQNIWVDDSGTVAGVSSSRILAVNDAGNAVVPLEIQSSTLLLNSPAIGMGISPEGLLHIHNGTGGWMFVTKTGTFSADVIVITNGTGDAVRGIQYRGIVYGSTSGFSSIGTNSMATPGAGSTTTPLFGNLDIKIYSTGQVAIVRSAGTETWTVALEIVWL